MPVVRQAVVDGDLDPRLSGEHEEARNTSYREDIESQRRS
jgi:hypothetical protein